MPDFAISACLFQILDGSISPQDVKPRSGATLFAHLLKTPFTVEPGIMYFPFGDLKNGMSAPLV